MLGQACRVRALFCAEALKVGERVTAQYLTAIEIHTDAACIDDDLTTQGCVIQVEHDLAHWLFDDEAIATTQSTNRLGDATHGLPPTEALWLSTAHDRNRLPQIFLTPPILHSVCHS